MKTISIVEIVLIVATGCSASTHTNPCEPSQPAETTCTETASLPEPHWCLWGEGSANRISMGGEVFLWHPLARCKRKVRSNTDPHPYDWMDTGVPCRPGVFFSRTPAKKCYMRGGTNQVLEVVNSPYGYEQAILDRAGWRDCSGEEYRQFLSARECP